MGRSQRKSFHVRSGFRCHRLSKPRERVRIRKESLTVGLLGQAAEGEKAGRVEPVAARDREPSLQPPQGARERGQQLDPAAGNRDRGGIAVYRYEDLLPHQKPLGGSGFFALAPRARGGCVPWH